MPRLKSVTDANGTKIYPVTITRGVYDTDKNQRLNETLANKAENTVMGASGSTHASGLVPDTPSTAGTTKYLREDGTWNVPVGTTYSNATTSAAGLMSAADKKKADNVMNLTNSATTSGSLALTPNILYSLGALTGALTVTLGSVISGIPNTYMMEFDINDDAATPTKVPNFPASIVWKDNVVWATGKHYEISIRYCANTQKYYGIFAEFDTAS